MQYVATEPQRNTQFGQFLVNNVIMQPYAKGKSILNGHLNVNANVNAYVERMPMRVTSTHTCESA